MNNIDKQYTDLLQDILDNGVTKSDRTGTGTISVFGRQIRHKMSEGFPLLTTKKMAWKTMVTELLWFLRGDTNIKFLVDNNCHIWDGDAYRNYEILMIGNPPERILDKDEFIQKIKEDNNIEHSPFTFAKKWGELGPIYGKQWRSWGGKKEKYQQKRSYGGSFGGPTHVEYGELVEYDIPGLDQIANLITDLKTTPDSRRLMVNAYNVGELDSMVLPPCHYGFQVYTRELSEKERYRIFDERGYEFMMNNWSKEEQYNKAGIPNRAISLMYNCRSQDLPLGTPFNISSYALLLEIIGKMVNMVPDELIANMGDCHIYLNQIDGVKEQLTREPYPLPTLKHMKTDEFYKSLSEDLTLLTHLDNIDFVVENYQSHPTIKFPLSN
jgi:thymidylate synthase